MPLRGRTARGSACRRAGSGRGGCRTWSGSSRRSRRPSPAGRPGGGSAGGWGPGARRRGEGVDVLLGLNQARQLPQRGGVDGAELDQLLDLVAQEQELQAGRPQPAAQLAEGVEDVVPFGIAGGETEPAQDGKR